MLSIIIRNEENRKDKCAKYSYFSFVVEKNALHKAIGSNLAIIIEAKI